jgi:hypothetical protein
MFSMTTNCVVVIYSHLITYSHIYSQVVLIMVVVKKMTTTKIQIWVHDYNWLDNNHNLSLSRKPNFGVMICWSIMKGHL